MRSMLFAGVRILDCPEVKEIHCHGTRRIEIRADDGRVCVWQCEDYVTDGGATFCVPRVKLVLPLQTFIANTQMIARWAFDRGLVSAPLTGLDALPPFGTKH